MRPPHLQYPGFGSFDAWERVREQLLGMARANQPARTIEGVLVTLGRGHDGHRTWQVAGVRVRDGSPLVVVVRAIVSVASEQGAKPLT